MKMIFTGARDVFNPWGQLRFGANTLQYLGEVSGLPPMRVHFAEPASDGSWQILGLAGLDTKRGRPGSLRIVRADTFDGLSFENAQTVLTLEGENWLGCTGIARNGRTGRYLVLSYRKEDKGYGLYGFVSEDARNWKPLSDKPVYYDHDAFSLFWDERTERFIAYQATYQKWRKPFNDNAPEGVRRVLHIRTSKDGMVWEPDICIASRGTHAPESRLITPDDQDPPDLEFYWFSVFKHVDRYVGMMLNYAASPPFAHDGYPWQSHGPYLSGEWWVSADGTSWDRPWRDIMATGEASGHHMHPPMKTGSDLVWIMNNKAYSVPENELFYIGSLSNSRFATKPFTMSKLALSLCAVSCFHGKTNRGWRDQSYIMAELTDESGKVIEGYEREKCIMRDVGFTRRTAEVKLHWHGRHGKDIEGRTVRLSLHMRDARIYSVKLPAGSEIYDEKI